MKSPHNTSISFRRIRRVRARRGKFSPCAYRRALVAAGLHPIAACVEAAVWRGILWDAICDAIRDAINADAK